MHDWKQIVREGLDGLKLDGAAEAEVIDELAQHLEDRYQELLDAGTPEADALRIAVEPLNSNPSLAEALRRARRPAPPDPPERANHLALMLYDLRMAIRGMRQKPGFSLMVVGMLALGIAGNAAIFSTFNSMFLKPLPFPDSSRLIDLDETAPKWNLHYTGVADVDLFAWREHNTTFESMAFFDVPNFNLSKLGPAQHIRGAKVSSDMLHVLKLKVLFGRDFLPEEDRENGDKVALLSYGLWQRLFAGDRGVLGRQIVLDDVPYRIIGVLPSTAVYPDRADVWMPLAIGRTEDRGWYLGGIGRLKPGVTVAQASADLLRVHRAQIAAGRTANRITSPILTPVRQKYLGDYRAISQALLVAVAVVLLIACVNIAALMLVRASARSHEMAIRIAIGSSRGRVIRQLLTENLVLAGAGGIAGIFVGKLGLQAIAAILPDSMPGWLDFRLDLRFAAFCIVITACSALLFGLAPALQASRVDMRSALHESARRASPSRMRRSALNILVISEIALALMLLISAGLLLQSFYRVMRVDPGFRVQNVLTFEVDLPGQKYAKPEQCVAFYTRYLDRLRALPGVMAAGAATAPPLDGNWGQFFEVEGERPLGPNEKSPVVLQVAVTPGYFDAIGTTLLAGRKFDERDGASKDHEVAIVSETFAHQHWPGRSPIGKRIRHQDHTAGWWQVVGVMRDEKHYGLDAEVRPTVYMPERQLAWPMSLSLVLRAASNPESLIAPARSLLAQLDPDLPMYGVHTMTERLDRSLWARRTYSWLFGAFSAVALILATAGIYGVISYAVSQRTQEIGIRMAMGATPGEVLVNVLRSGMTLVAIGAALGLTGTLAAAGLLESLLFGVSPRDPLIYIAVVLAVAAVGFLANALPARRAAALDPMTALRAE